MAVLCGGPSAERGISLNSARSVLDHIRRPGIDVECFYFDRALRAHAVSAKQMYSNTPSDFDFKLRGRAGGDESSSPTFFPDPASLASHLAARRAVAFPAVHGTFGEDGSLQTVLEEAGVPFVGAGAAAAGAAFDKALCASALAAAGFPTLRAALLEAHHGSFPSRHDVLKKLTAWFTDEGLDLERAWVVVKPCGGGSSLGVSAARGVDEAADAAVALLGDVSVTETASFRKTSHSTRVLVERHAGDSAEFTVVVVETASGPVALAPTEVEVFPEFTEGAFGETPERDERDRVFDFRAKYLPSSRVAYHSPARFGEEGVAFVRRRAEEAFQTLGLRDCARLDGFYMPRDHPAVSWTKKNERRANANDSSNEAVFEPVFADVNVASGMEQTSFLFLQAAQAGMSHGSVLRGVLASACRREGVPARFRSSIPSREGASRVLEKPGEKTKVYVLFGGNTSERQVSLTSGVNVWLKLRSRPDFDVTPALLAPDSLDACGSELEDATVFRLSYARALRHTVEEVAAAARAREERFAESFSMTGADVGRETNVVRAALRDGGFFYDAFDADDDVEKEDASTESRASSLRAFASLVKKENAVVFLSVHGGVGEDGTLQAFFETNGVAFTGSGAAASRLCMDKSATGAALAAARLEGVTTCRKVTVTAWEMSEALASAAAAAGGASASDDVRRRGRDPGDPAGAWWARLVASVGGDARDGLCIKPNSDGCSTGVARLRSSADLWQYATAVTRGAATAAVGDQRVAMPSPPPFAFVLEPFVVASAVEVFFDERAGTENVRFKKDKKDNANTRLATKEEAVITDGRPLPERDPERDSSTTAPRVLIEITAGVYGAFGAARCLPPSATVAERACAVLSLEEKFQGGTGVNLTPVPPELIEASVLETIERRIASAANALGLEGFARVDAFADARNGDVVVIEANTVPGMTPSTVLFHQALAETPSLEPAAFLARAVEHAVRRRDDAMPGTGDGVEKREER